MPRWDYRCNRCARTDEKEFANLAAAADAIPCPEPFCGGVQHRRYPSRGGFVLKGTGFYKTDYASVPPNDSKD